jgi:hypothetical protein
MLFGFLQQLFVVSLVTAARGFAQKVCSGKRIALLSQEGSAARKGRAGGGSQANLVKKPLWNLPSHDLDFVSIVLPF